MQWCQARQSTWKSRIKIYCRWWDQVSIYVIIYLFISWIIHVMKWRRGIFGAFTILVRSLHAGLLGLMSELNLLGGCGGCVLAQPNGNALLSESLNDVYCLSPSILKAPEIWDTLLHRSSKLSFYGSSSKIMWTESMKKKYLGGSLVILNKLICRFLKKKKIEINLFVWVLFQMQIIFLIMDLLLIKFYLFNV